MFVTFSLRKKNREEIKVGGVGRGGKEKEEKKDKQKQSSDFLTKWQLVSLYQWYHFGHVGLSCTSEWSESIARYFM